MTTQPWHKSPCLLSVFSPQNIAEGGREHVQYFDPQACTKSDLECARRNNSYNCVSRRFWEYRTPLRLSWRCSGSLWAGQLDGEQLRSSRHRRELVGSQLPTPSRCLHFDQRRRGPVIPRTNGCLFGEQTRTGFHCNLCGVRQ